MEVVSESRDARLSALGFDASRQQTARSYRRRRIGMGFVRIIVYMTLSLWLLGGFTFTVKAWATALGTGVAQFALYGVLIYVLYWLPVVPLGILGGFFLERRYGVSVQGFRSWFGDAAKRLGIGLPLSVLAIVIVYFLLQSTPDR